MQKLMLVLLPLAMLALAALACAQDCMGITIWVKGYVVDAAGAPIAGAAVRVRSIGSFGEHFDLRLTTDAAGHFATEAIYTYECSPLEIQVSADGYASRTETYYPPTSEPASIDRRTSVYTDTIGELIFHDHYSQNPDR